MLFDAARHEALQATAWDEAAARAWIARFADDAQHAFTPDGLWPAHPRDADDDDGNVSKPFTMVYMGAAGVIDALDHLARAGLATSTINFEPLLADLAMRNLAQIEPWGHGVQGPLMGQTGILLLHYRLAPDRASAAAIADRIAAAIIANADHPSLEMLWGSPGTMIVALTMHELTGEARWADLFCADARNLLRTLLPAEDAPCRIWTQDLYGKHVRYIGAGHGFAGNASALIRGRHLLEGAAWGSWQDSVVETIHATALRDGALANWPAQLVPSGTPLRMLVQWCHGAPGIITSMAALPDPRLDELLVAAGELTWTAGPLTKGVGLCHGTDGNGLAMLKIFQRTGDQRWLDRARAFAMHAMLQSERLAAQHGQRRYALWSGDAGLAWYLWSCIEGDGTLPTLDATPLSAPS